MDINIRGYKANCGDGAMGDIILHKGHRMTESETRMAVNWGIENGYELASELPDDVVDAICDPFNDDYERYDDTPHFFTIATLRPILREIAGYRGYIEMTVDELLSEIEENI